MLFRMRRRFVALALGSFLVFAGCVSSTTDEVTEEGEVQDEGEVQEERVGTAEEALTWYCQGWQSSKYQYCLTRCVYNTALQAVGSEDWIEYGQCNSRAETYCQSHGWGAHYGACWGYYNW